MATSSLAHPRVGHCPTGRLAVRSARTAPAWTRAGHTTGSAPARRRKDTPHRPGVQPMVTMPRFRWFDRARPASGSASFRVTRLPTEATQRTRRASQAGAPSHRRRPQRRRTDRVPPRRRGGRRTGRTRCICGLSPGRPAALRAATGVPLGRTGRPMQATRRHDHVGHVSWSSAMDFAPPPGAALHAATCSARVGALRTRGGWNGAG